MAVPKSESTAPTESKTLLLVGAGHGHLYLLAQAHKLISAGCAVTVVDPGDFWYSGLAPGVFGGSFDQDADRVDVARLCRAVGARHIVGRATALERASKTLILDDGTCLPYDLISLNVGSKVPIPFPADDPSLVFTAKPMLRLLELQERVMKAWASKHTPRVAVVGAGASGCELACNLAGFARRKNQPIHITLIGRAAQIMQDAPKPVQRLMHKALNDFQIDLICDAQVVKQSTAGL